MKNFNKKKVISGKLKIMYLWMTAVLMIMSNNIVVHASNGMNIGKNAADIILENFYWVGIIAIGYGLVKCMAFKKWVEGMVFVIGGAIAAWILKNPSVLEKIGETFGKLLFQQ